MVKQIQLGKLKIGQGFKPVFIAELGINANGSLEKAMDMVDAAVEAGCDIVKIQHHLPEFEMTQGHKWQELMKKCALSIEQLAELKTYVEDEGVEFLVTPFSIEAAAELNSIGVNGFKIGSGEANHIPFLKAVAAYGKPMLISTGMSSRDELFATLDAVLKLNNKVILLNCTSTYPASHQEARLRRIEWLSSTFGLAVGQSDHTSNISTALGAIARGAVVIEKHFTLNKSWEGPDQAASILPSEFRQMVDMGLEIWAGLSLCIEADMGVLTREKAVKEIANHSLVSDMPIQHGEMLSPTNTTFMRGAALGIPAAEAEKFYNRRVHRDIQKGETIHYQDVS